MVVEGQEHTDEALLITVSMPARRDRQSSSMSQTSSRVVPSFQVTYFGIQESLFRIKLLFSEFNPFFYRLSKALQHDLWMRGDIETCRPSEDAPSAHTIDRYL